MREETTTPTSPYFSKDGAPLPGTTTIISRFKESGGLLHWAHKVGYQQGLNRERANLYGGRDIAAGIGTFAHALIEALINDEPEPPAPDGLPTEDIERGRNAFQQFLRWQKQTGIFVVSWEKPLISEQHRYGGTIDSIGEIDGLITLLDWKTSAGTYPDNLLQLAAYQMLWEENYPDQPIHGAHIVRFSKDFQDVEHRTFQDLSLEKKQFLLLREAYANDLIIKQRI